jgi:hypothetical protein
MSEVVMSFLEPENDESRLSKYGVQVGLERCSPPARREKTQAASRVRPNSIVECEECDRGVINVWTGILPILKQSGD